MKILLIRPPDPLQHATLLSHTKPLNLAYIAAYMIKNGFNVKIVDYEIEPFSDKSFFQLLKDYQAAVIGVSCMTPTIKNGALICRLAKQFDSSIKTVVGGVHASGLPIRTMEEFPSFDYLVYGEGEVTFHELCLRLQDSADASGIDGIVYRDNAEIIRNNPRELIEDLDSLPFPARSLLDFNMQAGHSARGFSNKISSMELFTSRGCPVGCTYCAIQVTFGNKVRFRKTSFLEEEIKQSVLEHKFDHVIIADDTFSLKEERAFQICDILSRTNIKSWSCDTRVNNVTKRLLFAMKESGCQKVAFGVESGSQRIIDLIGKKISIEQVKDAVHWAKEAGIKHIEGNFIIGSDISETMEDIEMTKKLITSLPWTFVSVTIIVPYPGTPIYKLMKEKKLLNVEAWEDFVMFGKLPKWNTEHFSPTELFQLQKQLTKAFYLNPKYIINQLLSIRSLTDVHYWVSSGLAYFKWYLTGKV